MELRLHTLGENLRRIVSVKPTEFPVNQTFQILHGVLDFRGEQVVGHRPHGLAHIGDFVGVLHHNLVGLFLPQIGEFRQHIVGGAEVQGHGLVRVGKALGGKKNMPEYLVLRIQEVDVAGGHHHFSQFLTQLDDFPVIGLKILVGFRLIFFVIQHEPVVSKRLHLQKIIEGGNALEFIVALPVKNGLEQFAGFTGRADNQPLPHFQKLRLGNPGHPAEVLQIGIGDQVV